MINVFKIEFGFFMYLNKTGKITFVVQTHTEPPLGHCDFYFKPLLHPIVRARTSWLHRKIGRFARDT